MCLVLRWILAQDRDQTEILLPSLAKKLSKALRRTRADRCRDTKSRVAVRTGRGEGVGGSLGTARRVAVSHARVGTTCGMVSNVEAAAQSSIGQCSWSVPITGSSWSSWLSSTMHQQHLSPRDGWVPRRCTVSLLCAWRASPDVKLRLMARPEGAAMP